MERALGPGRRPGDRHLDRRDAELVRIGAARRTGSRVVPCGVDVEQFTPDGPAADARRPAPGALGRPAGAAQGLRHGDPGAGRGAGRRAGDRRRPGRRTSWPTTRRRAGCGGWPSGSGSPTGSGWSARWRGRTCRRCCARRTWWSARPGTSRSGSCRWRRWPAACRWWRPRSAASWTPSWTARPACWCRRAGRTALAAAMRRLLAEPFWREAYGAAGVDRARSRYAWDRIAAGTAAVYARVLGGRRRSRPAGRRTGCGAGDAVSRPAARRPLVVVGDALLDRDVTGRADRLSPDAPVPVVSGDREAERPGGAALAALLAAALDGRRGACWSPRSATTRPGRGWPAAGRRRRSSVVAGRLPGRTPVKERVRVAGRSLLRLDREDGTRPRCRMPRRCVDAVRSAGAVLPPTTAAGCSPLPELRRRLTEAARRGAGGLGPAPPRRPRRCPGCGWSPRTWPRRSASPPAARPGAAGTARPRRWPWRRARAGRSPAAGGPAASR